METKSIRKLVVITKIRYGCFVLNAFEKEANNVSKDDVEISNTVGSGTWVSTLKSDHINKTLAGK